MGIALPSLTPKVREKCVLSSILSQCISREFYVPKISAFFSFKVSLE